MAEAKLQQQLDIIEQQTRAQRMVIESQGIAQKRAIEGYSYQEERGFSVAERVADNEGVGEFANMGIGRGVMAGVGGAGGALGGFCGFGGDVLGRLVDALFGSGGVLGGIGHGVSVLTARSFAFYYK